jgi:hypothetical protein
VRAPALAPGCKGAPAPLFYCERLTKAQHGHCRPCWDRLTKGWLKRRGLIRQSA